MCGSESAGLAFRGLILDIIGLSITSRRGLLRLRDGQWCGGIERLVLLGLAGFGRDTPTLVALYKQKRLEISVAMSVLEVTIFTIHS